MWGEAGMTINEHLVYFYKFIVPGIQSADILMREFGANADNINHNSKRLRKNYVLFIADKKIDNDKLIGRLLKINIGLFRRIDMNNGKEWLEEIRKENGIEYETYVFINLKEKVMAATYNSESFGILDTTIINYFYDILKINNKEEIRIQPLALPDDIIELLKSKYVDKIEFKLTGDEVRLIQDSLGEGAADIIKGDKTDPILSITIHARYIENKKSLKSFIPIINYFVKKKSNDKNKKINYRKEKGMIATETGYYSLIQPTILNDNIKYDDQSEYDLNNTVFDELIKSVDNKKDDIQRAIELSEKEHIDYYIDYHP